MRKAKPANKPRDASMAPEPVTINAQQLALRRRARRGRRRPDGPRHHHELSQYINPGSDDDDGRRRHKENAEIIQTTLTDAEVARCVRPASMKDYVQARIDGAIETRCGGRDYKNRYTAADGTERRQFEVTATHVRVRSLSERADVALGSRLS